MPEYMGIMAMDSTPIIVWFRRDLRVQDNSALSAAMRTNRPLVLLYIDSAKEESPWPHGAASRWWLHHALVALKAALKEHGADLTIRRGPALEVLNTVIRESGATAVYWNRLYEPAVIARDKSVKASLKTAGIDAQSFNSALLHEPWTILTQQDKPYQVFTPFYRSCQATGEPPSPEAPVKGKFPTLGSLKSLDFQSLELLPTIPWDRGMKASWTPGEAGAQKELKRFLNGAVEQYSGDRDRPDHVGTSRLSPHLHFGEIGPRQIWSAVRKSGAKNVDPYLRQLIWREFAHHLLYHFPQTPEQPLRSQFANFPWSKDAKLLKLWQKGRTGYPIVDAGMRELWRTGWMHNRVRMIVGSFLVKDLLIPWQEGAAWFWDTLVDADLANNTLGWQWIAGCGADAAPYFRIFNPYLQAAKFDPDGSYVRKWIPELAKLDAKWIHEPTSAPPDVLKAAGVRLGESYPHPIVDHAKARDLALEAYSQIKL